MNPAWLADYPEVVSPARHSSAVSLNFRWIQRRACLLSALAESWSPHLGSGWSFLLTPHRSRRIVFCTNWRRAYSLSRCPSRGVRSANCGGFRLRCARAERLSFLFATGLHVGATFLAAIVLPLSCHPHGFARIWLLLTSFGLGSTQRSVPPCRASPPNSRLDCLVAGATIVFRRHDFRAGQSHCFEWLSLGIVYGSGKRRIGIRRASNVVAPTMCPQDAARGASMYLLCCKRRMAIGRRSVVTLGSTRGGVPLRWRGRSLSLLIGCLIVRQSPDAADVETASGSSKGLVRSHEQ